MRRARGTRQLAGGERSGPMALERLLVVLVPGAVELAAGRPYEGRVEVADRVVRLGLSGFGTRGGRCHVELSTKVRMDRSSGVLELPDRTTGDVLDDRLEAPAGPAPRRPVRRRLLVHAGTGVGSAV